MQKAGPLSQKDAGFQGSAATAATLLRCGGIFNCGLRETYCSVPRSEGRTAFAEIIGKSLMLTSLWLSVANGPVFGRTVTSNGFALCYGRDLCPVCPVSL